MHEDWLPTPGSARHDDRRAQHQVHNAIYPLWFSTRNNSRRVLSERPVLHHSPASIPAGNRHHVIFSPDERYQSNQRLDQEQTAFIGRLGSNTGLLSSCWGCVVASGKLQTPVIGCVNDLADQYGTALNLHRLNTDQPGAVASTDDRVDLQTGASPNYEWTCWQGRLRLMSGLAGRGVSN